MFAVAAVLVVALAVGEPKVRPVEERPKSFKELNAARARVGLLPRKPPPRASAVSRTGRRLVRVSGSAPTHLGEPGTLPGAEAPIPGPATPAAAPDDRRNLRLLARGVTTDVTLSLRFD